MGSVDRRGAYAVAAECHPVEHPGKGYTVILSAWSPGVAAAPRFTRAGAPPNPACSQ